jgi:MFS family permease
MEKHIKKFHPILNITVIVSALGYFVDMYDLLLFLIIRKPSLEALGYFGQANTDYYYILLNMQMGGMLIGGIIWGIIGDKKGRLNVLFGSILLYSIANIANAFVTDINAYAICRILAGIGLSGELGAAVTLVSEILPKEHRGYGTAIVASVGILGSVVAAIVGDFLPWQWAYIVGGMLGIMLLILRLKMFEPLLFLSLKDSTVKKGDFLSLFTNKERFFKYSKCILIGVPTWFVVSVLIGGSDEFSKFLNIQGTVKPLYSIMFTYIGLVIGDVGSGFSSQLLKSRRKIVLLFLVAAFLLVLVYLFLAHGVTNTEFYTLCFFIGIAIGYWAVFVTIGAEQFGTNLRATVATTVPNFVRGMTIPITALYALLKGYMTIVEAALIVGVISFAVAFLALWRIEESYHKDLDYLEK